MLCQAVHRLIALFAHYFLQMISIMMQTNKKEPSAAPTQTRSILLRVLSILFWLLVWQLISMQRTMGIFLASPLETVRTFFRLSLTGAFWRSMLFTTGRITTGFLLAVCVGSLLAALTERVSWLDILLMPVMRLIRTVPVVSFIILALILVSSRYLTQLISFLMAMPIVYMNVRTGIGGMDRQLSEMAALFRVSLWRRLRYLYLPQVMPAFETGTVLSLGFAWKSGIAAEVIGIPTGSVGERLQQAKVFLDTPDLFAWTLAVVLASILLEKVWRLLIKAAAHALTKTPVRTGRPAADAKGQALRVRLEDISKSYDGRPVLEHFTDAVAPGEIRALMGPSGVGKTTLLRLAAGLEQPEEGAVLLETGSGPEAAARSETHAGRQTAGIGFMFQEDRLLEYLDASGNVQFVNPACSRETICRELENLGIPKEDCARPVSEFSGGMKRRVALLRTVLAPSGLLLLDEPFKGLDEESAEHAITWLLKQRQGRTVILSTHSAREAALCGAKITTL